MRVATFIALLSVLLLNGCTPRDAGEASPDANAPHATVALRDGTDVAGVVRSSTPSAITLNLDSGGTRTILTKDVKSVQYDQLAANADTVATPVNPPRNGTPASATPRTPNQPDAAVAPVERVRPDKTAIQSKTLLVPTGTEMSIRSDETIDSEDAAENQTYAADVTTDVRDANGDVVIPRGANAKLTIKSATKGGRIKGASDLVVALRSISVGGKEYLVNATDFQQQGKDGIGVNKRTGEYVGGAAALGAVIGAIAGKGKGAAIGAASGAGAGAVAQVLTKGDSIKIPAETLMTFKLEEPLRIIERK
jgi:hypothetical protein